MNAATTKLDKANAAKRQKAAQFATQTVRIDDNWRVIRFDELNWEIQFKAKFKGYYPTIVSALKALPVKMLNEEAKNSLAEVLRGQERILTILEKALP